MFSFQFLNDKIHNCVLFEIIVNSILQKLKNKHTFLKKYTNSAKEVSFAQRSKSSRILYFKIIALFSGDSWNLILFSWPSVLVVLCDKFKLRESRLLTFKQILSKALLLLKIAALFSCDHGIRNLFWNPTIFNIIRWHDGTTVRSSRCLMVQCLFW